MYILLFGQYDNMTVDGNGDSFVSLMDNITKYINTSISYKCNLFIADEL